MGSSNDTRRSRIVFFFSEPYLILNLVLRFGVVFHNTFIFLLRQSMPAASNFGECFNFLLCDGHIHVVFQFENLNRLDHPPYVFIYQTSREIAI